MRTAAKLLNEFVKKAGQLLSNWGSAAAYSIHR